MRGIQYKENSHTDTYVLQDEASQWYLLCSLFWVDICTLFSLHFITLSACSLHSAALIETLMAIEVCLSEQTSLSYMKINPNKQLNYCLLLH